MKGSPAKLGTIQGTSGHASALKQVLTPGEISKMSENEMRIYLDAQSIKEQAKSKKGDKITTQKEKEVKTEPSEKTKRLREQVTGSDFKTEKLKEREEQALDIDAMTRKERNIARKKGELGYLGKGLFGCKLKRKRAGKKYEKQQKKEDKRREHLAKSEAWDKLSPDEKTAKQREKMAYLTAMFDSDARTMYQISRGQANAAKTHTATEPEEKSDLDTKQNFGINWLEGGLGSLGGGFDPLGAKASSRKIAKQAKESSRIITESYKKKPGKK